MRQRAINDNARSLSSVAEVESEGGSAGGAIGDDVVDDDGDEEGEGGE